jgi:DNA polymerase-3 subunit alpha
MADLESHKEGVIALAGGRGAIWRLVTKQRTGELRKLLHQLKAVYGRALFVEAVDYGDPDDFTHFNRLEQIVRLEGLRTVLTNAVRFVAPEDRELYVCRTGDYTVNPQAHLKSSEEMLAVGARWAQAIAMTEKIAGWIDLSLELHTPKVPSSWDGRERLQKAISAGLVRRYGSTPPKPVLDRLQHEVEVVNSHGLADFFLVAQDLVDEADRLGVVRGPGKGSGTGCQIAYVLGITGIDAVKHGCSFERFINPGRRNMPDLDLDFERARRDELYRYLCKRYPEGWVANLLVLPTLSPRGAIRIAAAYVGMDTGEVNSLAKSFPTYGSFATCFDQYPHLKRFPWDRSPWDKLLRLARRLEGLPQDHSSLHPCGIIIGDRDLRDYAPIEISVDGFPVVQLDKNTADNDGWALLKLDLLCNRQIDIRERIHSYIRDRGEAIPSLAETAGDPATIDLLKRGATLGIGQLDSAIQDLMRAFVPKSVEDLAVILALYRPGPIEGGLTDRYVFRRAGLDGITYPSPLLEPILKPTLGLLVYQDQILDVCLALGMDPKEADDIRKAVSKRIPALMERCRDRFIEAGRSSGLTELQAKAIFDLVSRFSGYGYVRGHSMSCAELAWQLTYLKAHYPAEFFSAILAEPGGYNEVPVYLEDAIRFGVEVKPPDINISQVQWSAHGGAIYAGLSQVREMGEPGARSVVETRQHGPFVTLLDFWLRVNAQTVNRPVIGNLIRAGAFDAIDPRRHRLLWQLEALRGAKVKAPPSLPLPLAVGDDVPAAPRETFTPVEVQQAEREMLGFVLPRRERERVR